MDEKVLKRYIKGKATLKEQQQVADWMDADKANAREIMALHKLNDITIMNQIETPERKSGKKVHSPSARKIVLEIMKVAAIVAILLSIHLFIQTDTTGNQTVYAPAGQRTELTLPDGTKVWLNSHTRLTYPLTFKEQREVKLDGEAYFTVTHNDHPFVVRANGIDIQVLGTEFNVKAYSESGERQVDLLEGSVELSGKAMGKKTLRMKPKESVRIAGGNLQIHKIDDYDYFKWKEGVICFNHESVSSIIGKLELYYDIKIAVEKRDFLKEHYSGKFRTKDGIEQVLKILQLEHEFTYTKDSNLNLITIK